MTNDMGNTPLHESAYHGMYAATEALLKAGSATEVKNDDRKGGITPLLAAVSAGKLMTVRALLRGGADPATMPNVPLRLFKANEMLRVRKRSSHDFESTVKNLGSSLLSRVGTSGKLSSFNNFQGSFNEWMIPGYGALSVALASGELEIVSELLLWGWRSQRKRTAVLQRSQVSALKFSTEPKPLMGWRLNSRVVCTGGEASGECVGS